MTKPEYIEFHRKFCEEMQDITQKKNADYTGQSQDPFANFTRVEALGICTTEQGFLTRMTDKLCRLSSFVQNGTLQVKDESVQDTLKDLANYSALLAAYIESKKPRTYLDVTTVAGSTPCPTEKLAHGKPEYQRRNDAIAP